MFKTLASCSLGIVVAVIVGGLIWTTLNNESAHSKAPSVATLANGAGNTQPVMAFTSTEILAEYLISAADRNGAVVKRITESNGALSLDAGTAVEVLGISGPGQTKVKITSGPSKDRILYVSYATIQGMGR